jgi:hypothetical protein
MWRLPLPQDRPGGKRQRSGWRTMRTALCPPHPSPSQCTPSRLRRDANHTSLDRSKSPGDRLRRQSDEVSRCAAKILSRLVVFTTGVACRRCMQDDSAAMAAADAGFLLVLRGLPGPGRSAFGRAFFRNSHLGPRTSGLARLRLRGLGFAVASYTWASRGGDLGVHPRCSDTSSAFEKEGRSRGPCTYLAYGRSTCAELASRVDTKVSHDDTVSWTKSWCERGRPSGPLRRSCYEHSGLVRPFLAAAPLRADDRERRDAVDRSAMGTSQQSKRRCFVGSTHTNLRDGESLRCPPSRRVPHKWSGRRPIRTWSAQRTFRYETRRTCLSSEGGHRRLCAATPEHRRLCAATSTRRRLCASPSSASPAFREEPFF